MTLAFLWKWLRWTEERCQFDKFLAWNKTLNTDVLLCSQKLKLRSIFRESLLLTHTNGPSRVLAHGNEVEHKTVCKGRMSTGTASCYRNESRGPRCWIWSIGKILSGWEFVRASEYYKPLGKKMSPLLAVSFLGEHRASGIQDRLKKM